MGQSFPQTYELWKCAALWKYYYCVYNNNDHVRVIIIITGQQRLSVGKFKVLPIFFNHRLNHLLHLKKCLFLCENAVMSLTSDCSPLTGLSSFKFHVPVTVTLFITRYRHVYILDFPCIFHYMFYLWQYFFCSVLMSVLLGVGKIWC